ncbi:putative uncharacterized protein DDB_G0282133 [Mytilus californianus]|uniref:putative uncharacterized protein DDB_G0282133 n=1 Tax=Mytilus californianus TaxID=6549 RepID=UPI002246814C|nr:putative uncharacterized protein DDB_G0282133 [Mytilus californianus]
MEESITHANTQVNQVIPETSTPVLTRASILRTSSQRMHSWSSSQKQSLDRKDSVRFKLSLPQESHDSSFADSDSDSNIGFYTINTKDPKEKVKRKRKVKETTEGSDWQPVVQKLKDNKESVRQKIKPGYVSQLKKMFSSQDDSLTKDIDTSSKKSSLKRHNSANDVSNRYLSVAKTTVTPSQRTNSLTNINNRADVSSLRKSYDEHGEPYILRSKSTENLAVKPQPEKAIFNTADKYVSGFEVNSDEFHQRPSDDIIREGQYHQTHKDKVNNSNSRNKGDRKPVHRKRVHSNGEFSGKSHNVNNTCNQSISSPGSLRTNSVGSGENTYSLQRSVSMHIPNKHHLDTRTNEAFIRTGSMRTTGALRDFLQKRYPDEVDINKELHQSVTVQSCKDRNNTEVNDFVMQPDFKEKNDWEKRTQNKIDKHKNESSEKLYSPRSNQNEKSIYSPRLEDINRQTENRELLIRSVLHTEVNTEYKRNNDNLTKVTLKPNDKAPIHRNQILQRSVSERIANAITEGKDNIEQKPVESKNRSYVTDDHLDRSQTKGFDNGPRFHRAGSNRIANSPKQITQSVNDNFQRFSSERVRISSKPIEKSSSPFNRTNPNKSATSADALKSFLRKRYPSREDVSNHPNIEQFSDKSDDNKEESEIDRLIFKFGIGNQSERNWDKITNSKIDDYEDKFSELSSSSRQMEPRLIQCPTLILETQPVYGNNENFQERGIDIPTPIPETPSDSTLYKHENSLEHNIDIPFQLFGKSPESASYQQKDAERDLADTVDSCYFSDNTLPDLSSPPVSFRQEDFPSQTTTLLGKDISSGQPVSYYQQISELEKRSPNTKHKPISEGKPTPFQERHETENVSSYLNVTLKSPSVNVNYPHNQNTYAIDGPAQAKGIICSELGSMKISAPNGDAANTQYVTSVDISPSDTCINIETNNDTYDLDDISGRYTPDLLQYSTTAQETANSYETKTSYLKVELSSPKYTEQVSSLSENNTVEIINDHDNNKIVENINFEENTELQVADTTVEMSVSPFRPVEKCETNGLQLMDYLKEPSVLSNHTKDFAVEENVIQIEERVSSHILYHEQDQKVINDLQLTMGTAEEFTEKSEESTEHYRIVEPDIPSSKYLFLNDNLNTTENEIGDVLHIDQNRKDTCTDVINIIPKKTPPKKPPRKKKSNPHFETLPHEFKESIIETYVTPSPISTGLKEPDFSFDTPEKSISTHDIEHKATCLAEHDNDNSKQFRSTSEINTKCYSYVSSHSINGNVELKSEINIETSKTGLSPSPCLEGLDRRKASNADVNEATLIDIDNVSSVNGETTEKNVVNTTELQDSVMADLLQRNCGYDNRQYRNHGTMLENKAESDIKHVYRTESDVIQFTNSYQPSSTNYSNENRNVDLTNTYNDNNTDIVSLSSDTSPINPDIARSPIDTPPMDEVLRNTEQQLCQTYLDLMDTWLAKRTRNRKTDDNNDSNNVKSEINQEILLKGSDQSESSDSSDQSESSDSSEQDDSSVEGEYIVDTAIADENEVLKAGLEDQNFEENSRGEITHYDENGEVIFGEIDEMNERESNCDTNEVEMLQIRSDEHQYETQSDDPGTHENKNTENTEDLRSALKLNLDFLQEAEDEEEIDEDCQTSLLEATNKVDKLPLTNNKVNKHTQDYNNTEYKSKRSVTFDVNTTEESEVIHACPTAGCDHVTDNFTGKTFTPLNPHLDYKDRKFSTTVDVHTTDLDTKTIGGASNDSKIAIIQELRTGATMPEKSSGNTNTSQMSEYKGGKKITTKTTSSVNSGGYNDEEQTTQKRNLALLTDAISKLNGENNDDIIPEINQTITKLNGGNLVITTLTHRVVEEEEDGDKSDTASLPVVSEPSNRNKYIVQDHKGDTYMIEDITDESYEYSTSDHRYSSEYESASPRSGSPSYQRIHNLRAHGNSGVDYNTAEEVILSLYNPNSMEYTETDERFQSGQYTNERLRQGQGQLQPYGYSDSSSNKRTTSYEYEDGGAPNQNPYGSSSLKTVKQSYEMSSDGPWVTDGKSSYVGSQDVNMKKEVTNQSSSYDQSGLNAMSAAYMVEANSSVPPIPQFNPYYVQQPLMLPPLQVPQYNLLQLEPIPQKVTTGVQVMTQPKEEHQIVNYKEEHHSVKPKEEHTIVAKIDETDSRQFQERPVYKSVALVKGPYESPKWHTAKKHRPYEPPTDEVDSGRKYKVVKSSASEDVKEETMEYEETTKTITTMKTDNVQVTGGQFLDQNRNISSIDVGHNRPIAFNGNAEFMEPRYTTERTLNVGRPATEGQGRQFRSTVEVNSGSSGRQKSYDQMDGYQSKLSSILNHQQHYQGTPEPERKTYTDVDRDMRVVRGNILIKNNFDENLDEYNDNINMFDNKFNMSKTNPLYHSDEDIYKRYEEEKRIQQEKDIRDMENMAFETVDRFSKSKNVTRKAGDGERRRAPRSKQNLTNLLLARLSTMDAKDIRQSLDVKHHHEDIYGDPPLQQADGTSSKLITTSNYDTVTENVDLEMRDGKAIITVIVTAERLTPIDYEFHVWRKNQAIVTRVVEIDFYADEQRRVLYDRVMDRVDDEGYANNKRYSHYTRRKPMEVTLSSQDTLDLFNELMEATGGEGDKEDITVKTKRNKTLLPENPFLY